MMPSIKRSEAGVHTVAIEIEMTRRNISQSFIAADMEDEAQQHIEATAMLGSHQEGTESVQDLNDPSEYPDGGWKAYIVVLGSFIGLIVDFGIVNSMGSVQSYLNLHQFSKISSSISSLVFSVFLFVTYASVIFSGAMFDELGANIPMIIGTILLFIGIFASGGCESVGTFVATFSIIGGLGVGMLAAPLTGVISHWFLRNRSKAFGLCTLGGSVGGIMFPLVLDKFYSEFGFKNGMRILAAICAFLLIISTLLITERIKPVSESNENQQASSSKKLKAFLSKTADLTMKSIDLSALKEPTYLLCALAVSFSELSLVCSMTYFASYVTYIGFSETKANTIITMMNAIGVAGRYVPNIFADMIGCYNVMTVMVLFAAMAILFVWLVWSTSTESMDSIYAYSALYGFFSASVLSLSPSCVGAISPTRDFGKRYGTMSLIIGAFILVGMTIGGTIIGHESLQSYKHFSLYCGLLGISSVVLWLSSRYCQVGFKINAKV